MEFVEVANSYLRIRLICLNQFYKVGGGDLSFTTLPLHDRVRE